MTKTKVLLVLGGLAILIVGIAVGSQKNSFVGALVGDDLHVVGNIYNGYADTLLFKNGVFQGAPIATSSNISVAGNLTVTGTSTLGVVTGTSFAGSGAVSGATLSASGALTSGSINTGAITGTGALSVLSVSTGNITATGTVAFSGNVSIVQAASSTLYIGGANNTGCLALGDSSSPTSTNVVYLTASGSTVTATTTKPAECR